MAPRIAKMGQAGKQQQSSSVRSLFAAQRAGLRLYQWLWLLLCVATGLIVFLPRVVSQPIIYETHAETHFAMARYGGLYSGETPSPDFQIAVRDATEAVRQQLVTQGELRFGLPNYRVDFVPMTPGTVQIRGIASTGHEAAQLATMGAEELVRHIQAAGGREIMRNLLGWELVVAMRGDAMTSPFERHLRAIIERDAFPMSRPIEPVSQRLGIENLTPDEQNDLARALEARYALWTAEINARNTTLDALCGTAHAPTTRIREAALQQCTTRAESAVAPSAQYEREQRNRAIQRRQAINDALRAMLDNATIAPAATFRPDNSAGIAYRTAATVPNAPIERHIPVLLAAIVLASLAVGGFGVLIDRTAGVMAKLCELVRYQELIRDLVVRDLRVRYKGSMLGYLWTQLAPLLMMMVFTFVFTLLMPTGVALFPVFLIVALLPWNYCSEAIASGTRSVIDNANLIKKVFFPREILPLVSVLSSLLNYILSLPMMFLVMAGVQWFTLGTFNFSWTFLYLPVIILLQTLFLIGIIFFLSALAVFFRDIVHLIGILIMFWFFLTPVFYSLDNLTMPNLARFVRWFNPMASFMEFYREILYGNAVGLGMVPTPALPAADSILRVMVTTVVVLACGYWFFQRQSTLFGEEL